MLSTLKQKTFILSCVLTMGFVGNSLASEEQKLQQMALLVNKIRRSSRPALDFNDLPTVKKCNEIRAAFIESEVMRKNITQAKARIEKKRQQFEESERGRRTEVMRYFKVSIERTFPEDSQEPLARLVLDAVKDQELTKQWGWNIRYQWEDDGESTRVLWCQVDVQPEELLSAYHDDV